MCIMAVIALVYYITYVHHACPNANYEEMSSDLFDEPFNHCFDLPLPLTLPLHPVVDRVTLIPRLPSSALCTSPTSRVLCFPRV